MNCFANAASDAALAELLAPRNGVAEPSPGFVARCGTFLERSGWLKSVAGEADFAAAAHALAKALLNKLGIVVSGVSGVGKTAFLKAAFGASRLGTAFVDLSDPVEAEKLDALVWPNYRKQLLEMHVILDDMGSEARMTNFGQNRELAAEFVHAYHARGRGRLFVSTNLDGRKFLDRYEERVFTRLMEICVPLKFTGGDKRTKAAANRGPAANCGAAANCGPAAKGGAA